MELERTTIAGFPGLRAIPQDRARRSPVVFVHGTNQDHRHFAEWLRQFARAGFDCYAMPRRGRAGVPPLDAAGVGFADYMEDTRRVLGSLDQPAIVVGHSFGGLLAQKVAEEGLCEAAVLLAPLAPRDLLARLLTPPPAIPLYLKILPAVISGRPFRVGFSDLERASLNCVPAAERRQIYETFLPESGLMAREVLIGIPVDARSVRCPMLCVAGREDRFVSVSLVRAIARKYRADLHEYEGHGHFLLRDAGWETIAADVVTWLSALPTGAAV